MIVKFSLKSNMKNMKDLPLTSTPPRGLSPSFSIILSASSKKSTLVSFFTSHSLFKHLWGKRMASRSPPLLPVDLAGAMELCG